MAPTYMQIVSQLLQMQLFHRSFRPDAELDGNKPWNLFYRYGTKFQWTYCIRKAFMNDNSISEGELLSGCILTGL